jgi:hypothetical protein
VLVLIIAIGYAVYANAAIVLQLFQNKPVTPTPTVMQTTVSPTTTAKVTIITTPPFTNTRTWLLKLDNSFLSASKLSKKGTARTKDVTATLYSPANAGEYLCMYEEAESVFLEKRADAGWVRLCDKDLPTKTPHQLRCQIYDPAKGIPVYATFYPIGSCKTGWTITPGDYQMHATVYTICEVDGNGIGTNCKGIVDVVSPRISVSN